MSKNKKEFTLEDLLSEECKRRDWEIKMERRVKNKKNISKKDILEYIFRKSLCENLWNGTHLDIIKVADAFKTIYQMVEDNLKD